MTTQASKGYGTTFVFDGVTVGLVTGFPENQMSLDEVEFFSCDATDEVPDWITGAFQEGSPSFTFAYDGRAVGSYKALWNKYRAKKEGSLVVTYKARDGVSTSSFTVTARLNSFTWPGFGSPKDVKMVTAGFRVLAKPTYADEAGSTASSSASSSPSASPSSSASA